MQNEEEFLILEVLDQLNTSIERENLFKELSIEQGINGISVYNIKQRTPEHFYCPELGVELRELVFRGLISLETRWNVVGFEQHYRITKYGEEALQESTDNILKIKERVK